MRILRHIGSLAFVLGLFVVLFAGIPWHVMAGRTPDEQCVSASVAARSGLLTSACHAAA
jgi:hypothetical protein